MTALPVRTRAGYALGGIASGTYGTVPGLILMPYLTDLLGVEAAIAGLIVFAPKAWDFFLNPVAGRLSDRFRDRRGDRRPLILRAGILLALAFTAMFLGPTAPPLGAALWVLVAFLASATAYAFFQVPFLAMSAELTDDYAERTRMITWRVAVFSVAILASGASAPLVVELVGGVGGYRVMAAAMSVLIVVGALGVWRGTRGAATLRSEPAGGRLRTQLAAVLRDRDALVLIVAYVLQAVAIGMVLGGVVYVARHVLGDPSAATAAFACFVAPAVVVMPLWSRLGSRIGKQRGHMVATVVMGLGLLGLLVAQSGQTVPMLIAAAVVGIGYAGAQLFPLAMLPDIAAEDAKREGVNRIGMISGVWSGFELLGYALGPALLGLVLALGGYISSAGADVAQGESARWAIVLGVSAIPALLCALSLIPLSRYRLDARLRAAGS